MLLTAKGAKDTKAASGMKFDMSVKLTVFRAGTMEAPAGSHCSRGQD